MVYSFLLWCSFAGITFPTVTRRLYIPALLSRGIYSPVDSGKFNWVPFRADPEHLWVPRVTKSPRILTRTIGDRASPLVRFVTGHSRPYQLHHTLLHVGSRNLIQTPFLVPPIRHSHPCPL